MPRPLSRWVNKEKHGKRIFNGYHDYVSKHKDRVFILEAFFKNGKPLRKTFESHQAAKEAGWRKR